LQAITEAETALADVDRTVRQSVDLQAAIDHARQVSIVEESVGVPGA
jgi:hypothetical protein